MKVAFVAEPGSPAEAGFVDDTLFKELPPSAKEAIAGIADNLDKYAGESGIVLLVGPGGASFLTGGVGSIRKHAEELLLAATRAEAQGADIVAFPVHAMTGLESLLVGGAMLMRRLPQPVRLD